MLVAMFRPAFALVFCVAACSKADPAPTPSPGPAAPAPAAAPTAAPAPAAAPEGSGHHEDRHDKPVAPTTIDIEVTVDGKPAHWGADEFAKVDKFVGKNNDGDDRDMWSLRDLAHKLVGPSARVVSITGDHTDAVATDAWSNAARTPILHNTRKGHLKFRWTDQDGGWLKDDVVKDVAKLEVVTK
jgi:hypothetical protein